jgi:transcriptional regulator of acetoin/glycerol metabolism
MVEQTATLSSDTLILPDDLPPKYRQFQKGQEGIQAGAVPLTLQEVTERHIRAMLKRANGNKKLAAELLGIPRRTLYRLAQRYRIDLTAPQ